MYTMANRFGWDPTIVQRTTQATWNQYKKWNPGDVVFVCSLSDFFHEDADQWREEYYELMRKRPDVIFVLLTKRIERAADHLPDDWNDGWPNVILMVTAEDQASYNARVLILLNTPAAVRGVSIEPMLEEIDPNWIDEGDAIFHPLEGVIGVEGRGCVFNQPKINWIIVGGESGSKARYMDTRWAEKIRVDCQKAGVAFFYKQNSHTIPTKKSDKLFGQQYHQFPEMKGIIK